MARRDIIVIGASAGGVEALQVIARGLPADLHAAVLVVLHIPAHTESELAAVLDRAGPLRATRAVDGEVLAPGRIYVAATGQHMMLEGKHVRLTRGPKENRVRPSIDVLFRSAAAIYGPRVIGVVLSGMLDDGTAGLWAVKDRGGVAIVQAPLDAGHPSMPESALKHVAVDHAVPAREIPALLVRLTNEVLPDVPPVVVESMAIESEIALTGNALSRGVMKLGTLSPNTCPACHGVLVKIEDGPILRFRCHTGHAFSLKTLITDVDQVVEDALWAAMRALEERALLLDDMESLARRDGNTAAAVTLEADKREATRRAQVVRALALTPSGDGLA